MNKIELMKQVTASFSLYEAGRWLNKPRAELNGDTPAKYIQKNKIAEVQAVLESDVKKNEKRK